MNIEEKYKLFKEKYKGIKEQNDILKKAILEYKNDIKELEKSSYEKTTKINDLLNDNKVLLSNNKQLSNKVTQLNTYLDEQKKNNSSGWRNLRLLKKSSQEFDNSAVAYEELENKIHENETLHKKIEALQNDFQNKEKEIETITKKFDAQLKEKEQVIKHLNEKIEESSYHIQKAEKEKKETIKETQINKKHFDETIKEKNKNITQLEDFCTKLKNKCYNKYKISFDKIPFFEKYNYDNYSIQNEIHKTIEKFHIFILKVTDNCIKYVSASKQLFIFHNIDIEAMYKNVETDKEDCNSDYYRIGHLMDIAKSEVTFFEEVLNSLIEFKRKWTQKESIEQLNDILNLLSNQTKRLFIKIHIFLYVEEYYFPSEVHAKKFRLKNINRELRNLKKLILQMVSLFAFVIFAVPYNNQDIIAEYFRKTRIKKKIDKNDPTKYVYYNDALYEELSNIDALSEDEEEEEDKETETEIEENHENEKEKKFGQRKNIEEEKENEKKKEKEKWKGNAKKKQNEKFSFNGENLDAPKFITEKEKIMLSKYEHLKNYAERNNRIINFLIKKWKDMCDKFLNMFEFLRSYLSFRMCERKTYASLNFGDSKKFCNLLDLTNYFINSIENFDASIFRVFFISIFSYYRFNTYLNFKEEQKFLNVINQAFHQTTSISFSSFQNSLKDLKWYKKNYSLMNKSLRKKKNFIKMLKTVNRQAVDECKSISLLNSQLQADNEVLKNSLHTYELSPKEINSNSEHVKIYADDILKFIIQDKFNNKGFTIKEKELLEAYMLSCTKIHKLLHQIEQQKTTLQLQHELKEKERENKNLQFQIQTFKDEEANIHKKYEEQMNTLHDLIVSLEKQITRLNSEKEIHNVIVECSFCENKNNIEHVLKNRKCFKCNSIILFSK